jgi:hypothetical protein
MAEPLQPVINTNTVAVDGDLAAIGGGAPGSPRSTARCTTTGHHLASCSIDMPLAARTRTSRPELADGLLAYYGDNMRRLQHIKNRYDPDNFFHHRQSIRPTTPRHAYVRRLDGQDRAEHVDVFGWHHFRTG